MNLMSIRPWSCLIVIAALFQAPAAAKAPVGVYYWETDRLAAAKTMLKEGAEGAEVEELRQAADRLRK